MKTEAEVAAKLLEVTSEFVRLTKELEAKGQEQVTEEDAFRVSSMFMLVTAWMWVLDAEDELLAIVKELDKVNASRRVADMIKGTPSEN